MFHQHAEWNCCNFKKPSAPEYGNRFQLTGEFRTATDVKCAQKWILYRAASLSEQPLSWGARSRGGVWKKFSRAKSIRVCQAAANGWAHSGGCQLACPLYTAHREQWKKPDTPVNIYCSNQMHNLVPPAQGLRGFRNLRWWQLYSPRNDGHNQLVGCV